MKHRRDRRPGFPVANPFLFYPKYFGSLIRKRWRLARLYYTYHPMRRRLESMPPPNMDDDVALKAVDDAELEELELYRLSDAARQAAGKARRIAAREAR